MNGGGGKYVEGEEAMVEASLRTMSLNNAAVPATDQMHVLLGDNLEKKRKNSTNAYHYDPLLMNR